MYVCIYIGMCVHLFRHEDTHWVHKYMYTHTDRSIYTNIHRYIYIYIYILTSIYVCMYVSMYEYACGFIQTNENMHSALKYMLTHIHTHIYVCIYIYIYIYIYMYIVTVLVVTNLLCWFVANQVQYNLESAQYLG